MQHRKLAALVLALALTMKALVPSGYMVGSDAARTLTIAICDGSGMAKLATVAVGETDASPADEHAMAAKDCPYAALGMQALSGADTTLLAAALAFILLLAFAPQPSPSIRRCAFLTPPLRGPPAVS